MNARELLKEARLAMLRSQPDEQIETIKRIDAYLVAPSESAMEAALRGLVRKMRDSGCSLAETIHGNEPCAKVFREAWDKACAEADKVLDEYTQATGGRW